MNTAGELIIDLSAIQKNWQLFDRMTSSKTKVAAVVKADAYGLGVEPVVRALHRVGCNHFFVATVEEAVGVKSILKTVFQSDASSSSTFPEIYILSAIQQRDFSLCSQENFIPVLYSVALIKQWAKFCSDHKLAAQSAIKLDSGMHRLGISDDEFLELLKDEKYLQACHPVLFMSHLACADEKDHLLNESQRQLFQICAEKIKALFPNIQCSLSNSAGIHLGESYHFDIVRAGIGLYGGNPSSEAQQKMSPVVELHLPILQQKKLQGPAYVGYGATAEIPAGQEKKLAIVAGGYADGLLRSLSNSGQGFISKYPVSIIGRVSMDSIVFDVTAVPNDVLKEESFVSVLNQRHQNVDDFADQASTISYEILTGLGVRYHRSYLQD